MNGVQKKQYNDHFISQHEFAWESKSRRSLESPDVGSIRDSSKEGIRHRADISFTDTLKMLKKQCHFVFIVRNITCMYDEKDQFLEIGFCTMTTTKSEYFLYIHCDVEHLDFFVDKYKLSMMK